MPYAIMPCGKNFTKLPRNEKIRLMKLWGIEQKEIAVVFEISHQQVNNILTKIDPDRQRRSGKKKEVSPLTR